MVVVVEVGRGAERCKDRVQKPLDQEQQLQQQKQQQQLEDGHCRCFSLLLQHLPSYAPVVYLALPLSTCLRSVFLCTELPCNNNKKTTRAVGIEREQDLGVQK